jgi:hypothetical protein
MTAKDSRNGIPEVRESVDCVLLTLIAPRELEEAVVDWLLDHGHEGFTSFACAGHGVAAAQLSVAEQVSGRKARVGFWLAVERAEAERVVQGIGREPMGSSLHFWTSALVAAGPLPTARD